MSEMFLVRHVNMYIVTLSLEVIQNTEYRRIEY